MYTYTCQIPNYSAAHTAVPLLQNMPSHTNPTGPNSVLSKTPNTPVHMLSFRVAKSRLPNYPRYAVLITSKLLCARNPGDAAHLNPQNLAQSL